MISTYQLVYPNFENRVKVWCELFYYTYVILNHQSQRFSSVEAIVNYNIKGSLIKAF